MTPRIDSGDTAWMLIATALVLLMTPGLALFYGGLVRKKNVLSTYMHSFFAMGLVTLQWIVIGYSLGFSPNRAGVLDRLVGGFDFALLNGVGLSPKAGMDISHLLFMAYQMMFAIIAPALISGAFAERVKFSAYVLFTLLWTTLVYDPIAHWTWAEGGWLARRGVLDFAGGTVVHVSTGVSALVFALVIGKRAGSPHEKHAPHNLTMCLLGAGLLWFGWFGFNAGSALGSGALAALALVNTQVAAAAAALAWAGIEWARFGKPSVLGFASGFIAGLVAVTPAAGFVGPMASVWIGLAAGGVCYGGVLLKGRLGYDDALDAFGIHGIGGALGAVLTGVFALRHWNAAGADGLVALTSGGLAQLGNQVLATAATATYAACVTFGVLKLVDAVVGLRVHEEEEYEGLDLNLHGEEGYAFSVSVAHRELPARSEEGGAAAIVKPGASKPGETRAAE